MYEDEEEYEESDEIEIPPGIIRKKIPWGEMYDAEESSLFLIYSGSQAGMEYPPPEEIVGMSKEEIIKYMWSKGGLVRAFIIRIEVDGGGELIYEGMTRWDEINSIIEEELKKMI
jgi:hypothetical protein